DRAGVVLHHEQQLLTGGRRVATAGDPLLADPLAAAAGGQAELPERRQLRRGEAAPLEGAQRAVGGGQTGPPVDAAAPAPAPAGGSAPAVRRVCSSTPASPPEASPVRSLGGFAPPWSCGAGGASAVPGAVAGGAQPCAAPPGAAAAGGCGSQDCGGGAGADGAA